MILGLTGQAGSGKSTIARALVVEHGFVEIGLADVLKRWAREAFDFTGTQLWGPSEARNGGDSRYPLVSCDCGDYSVPRMSDARTIDGYNHCASCRLPLREATYLSPRVALQTLGTEWGRALYEDVWIQLGLRTAQRVLEGYGYDPKFGVLSGRDNTQLSKRRVVISDVRFDNEARAIRAAGGKVFRLIRPDEKALEQPKHASETGVESALLAAKIMNNGTPTVTAQRIMELLQ